LQPVLSRYAYHTWKKYGVRLNKIMPDSKRADSTVHLPHVIIPSSTNSCRLALTIRSLNKELAMKTHRFFMAAAAVAATGLGFLVAPVIAHHASAPFYNPETRVEIDGPVTRFVFRNPHAFLYLDGPGDDGQTVEWQVELGAPVSLRRVGWTPESLAIGTVVKMNGQRSRAKGSYGICCVRMTREDGSPIVAGRGVQERDSNR
jgi:hypothetical protein